MPGASLWSQLGGDAYWLEPGRTDHDEPPRNVLIARQGADDLLVHMLIGPLRDSLVLTPQGAPVRILF